MKIGFIIPDYWNSIFPDLVSSINKMGIKVVVYTDSPNVPYADRFSYFIENGIEFYVINNKKRHYLLCPFDKLFKLLDTGERRFFTILLSIYKFIKKNKDCNIFIVEWDWTGFFVAIVNSLLPFKWIVGVHDLNNLKISLDYPYENRKFFIEKVKKWVYKKSTLIRANSFVTKNFLEKIEVNPSKIKVIPLHITNWMTQDKPQNIKCFREKNKEEIFSKYKIDKKNKLLISACRLTPVKGLELLIESFYYLIKEQPNIKLMICGRDSKLRKLDSYKEYLRLLARQKKIEDKIIFTDYIDKIEIKKYLAAADLNLVPSFLDTFNFSVLEAALVGTFSLVSANVGSAFWLEKYKVCEIINNRNPKCWAESVIKILNSGYEIDNKVINQIESDFSSDNIARQLLNILMNIC